LEARGGSNGDRDILSITTSFRRCEGAAVSDHRSPKDTVHKQAMKNSRRLSLRGVSAYVGLCLGAVVIAVAVFILLFGGMILNGYGKGKVERAFANAHPVP
jgi:hypothetical protein